CPHGLATLAVQPGSQRGRGDGLRPRLPRRAPPWQSTIISVSPPRACGAASTDRAAPLPVFEFNELLEKGVTNQTLEKDAFSNHTPMMAQYLRLKTDHPST